MNKCFYCYTVSQVLVSRSAVYEIFEQVQVSENDAVKFCVIVWGPLMEAVHIQVETTDSGIAQGEFMKKMPTWIFNKPV